MPTVKCDNCGHSVEVEDATKKYKLPLLFIFLGLAVLAYVRNLNNPSLIITFLGGQRFLIPRKPVRRSLYNEINSVIRSN